MIFALSEHFDGFDSEAWQPYLPAIENLLIAHIQGWHLFVPTRRTTRVLAVLNQLSAAHRTVLSVHIGERLATLSGQAHSVSRVIVCLPDDADLPANDNSIFVRLRDFIELENCFKSQLIVENGDSDGKFYLSLGKLLGNRDFANVPLALDIVHGGGATTAIKVRDAMLAPRPSLIVVDGDRRFPGAREGDTARQVQKEFYAKKYSTHVLHITEVKSVENFVPPSLGSIFLEGRDSSVAMISVIEQHCGEKIPQESLVAKHICYKKGIKYGFYRAGSAEFKMQVADMASKIGAPLFPPENADKSRDEEVAIPGVNARFIELFLGRLEEDSSFGDMCKAKFPEGSFFAELEKILRDVVAFGTAAVRIPVELTSARVALP